MFKLRLLAKLLAELFAHRITNRPGLLRIVGA